MIKRLQYEQANFNYVEKTRIKQNLSYVNNVIEFETIHDL